MIGQVQPIIRDAQVALQDVNGIHWSAAELVRYLRDGLLSMLQVKPEERYKSVDFEPVEGAKQTLPADAMRLLDIECNAGGRMRSITRIERHDLDATQPDWLSLRPTASIVHWMVSATEPRNFYLYPPAHVDARIDLTYCQYPPVIPEPATSSYEGVTGETGIEAKWSPVLLDYVLYRAWLKDAEYAGNAQLAAGYLSTFAAALGADVAAVASANQ